MKYTLNRPVVIFWRRNGHAWARRCIATSGQFRARNVVAWRRARSTDQASHLTKPDTGALAIRVGHADQRLHALKWPLVRPDRSSGCVAISEYPCIQIPHLCCSWEKPWQLRQWVDKPANACQHSNVTNVSGVTNVAEKRGIPASSTIFSGTLAFQLKIYSPFSAKAKGTSSVMMTVLMPDRSAHSVISVDAVMAPGKLHCGRALGDRDQLARQTVHRQGPFCRDQELLLDHQRA